MKSRNFAILAVLILIVVSVGTLFSRCTPDEIFVRTKEDFTFHDVRGTNLSFYNIQNKNIIVHFWATWCTPCLREFPELMQTVIDNPDVTLIAVSVDDDVFKMRKFLEPFAQSPRIIQVWDHGKAISKEFNVQKYPESLIYSANHKEKQRISGVADWKNFKFDE